MIKIIETDNYNDISYIIQTIKNNTVIEEHEIRCKSTTIQRNGKIYYLLFDRNYKLVKSVFTYINVYLENLKKAEQTRDKSLVALKFLYSYMNIFNIELEEMTNTEASKLITFMFGYNQEGSDFSLSFKSNPRAASSVNDYLSIMRNYIKFLNYRNHPLLRSGGKKRIKGNAFTVEYQKHGMSGFDIKAREYHRMQISKHITFDEFKTLVRIVYQEKNKRLECIIRLMYESGMRAGEVLSLTLEDLSVSFDEKNDDVYRVILRNRVSNHPWQSPKYLMKVFSKEDYKTREYKQRGFGYQVVYISKSLYELLLDYIDEAHSKQQIKNKKNWKKFTVTDSVDSNFKEKVNFYIFVNSIGKPYSKKLLDKEVKSIFRKAGVKLNADGGKFDGLCHRFRHGFAKYQVNYNKVPMLLLKELMRHTSLESTAIYYTPDTSTIIDIKNKMSKSISELLPEFEIRKEEVDV